MSGSEDFERGLRIRREVLGDEFVDANLSGSDAFMMTFQHLVTVGLGPCVERDSA